MCPITFTTQSQWRARTDRFFVSCFFLLFPLTAYTPSPLSRPSAIPRGAVQETDPGILLRKSESWHFNRKREPKSFGCLIERHRRGPVVSVRTNTVPRILGRGGGVNTFYNGIRMCRAWIEFVIIYKCVVWTLIHLISTPGVDGFVK